MPVLLWELEEMYRGYQIDVVHNTEWLSTFCDPKQSDFDSVPPLLGPTRREVVAKAKEAIDILLRIKQKSGS